MGGAREEEDEFFQAVPQDQTMNVLPLLNRYVVEILLAFFQKTKCVLTFSSEKAVAIGCP